MKKFICLFMIALMISPALIACGEQTDVTSDTTTQAVESTTSIYDENGFIKDTLPDNLNYNGKTVTLLGWKETFNEFGRGEIDGDSINDAVYYRDEHVQERLGVKFVQSNILTNQANEVLAAIQASINAQDGAYDILRTHSQTPGMLSINNMLIDLRNEEYINFDMPWWLPEYTKAATIEGSTYFASGDISPTLWRMMDMNFCNFDLLSKYNLEDPQVMAIEGKWTLDKMLTMITGVYEDLNQNGLKDGKDQFGLMSTQAILDAYFYASGTTIIERDEDDKLILSKNFAGEKIISIIEKMGAVFSTKDAYISTGDWGEITKEGRALFINAEVYFSERFLTDAAYTFKVLPVPKYSEDQETYPIVLSNPFTVYSIPADAPDSSMSAAVMEAMASDSYRRITPVIYDKLIKLRYVGSDTDAAMIDIIREGVIFDTARMFAFNFPNFYAFRTHVQNNLGTWSSTVAGLTESYTKTIETITKSYQDLKK